MTEKVTLNLSLMASERVLVEEDLVGDGMLCPVDKGKLGPEKGSSFYKSLGS